jgi:hypothetical protein
MGSTDPIESGSESATLSPPTRFLRREKSRFMCQLEIGGGGEGRGECDAKKREEKGSLGPSRAGRPSKAAIPGKGKS